MDGLLLADRCGLAVGHHGWQQIRAVLDWLADHWDQPEEGIWETRGGRKDFTYGRLMTWVALDRGIRLASAQDRKSTRLNSSHANISYAVFCLKKKNNIITDNLQIK